MSEAQLKAALAALHRYGRHHDNCETYLYVNRAHRHCTCGFVEARYAADPSHPTFTESKVKQRWERVK